MHISNAISISGKTSGGYVSKLVSAYVDRVTADGGVVEAKSCVKAAFKELGAEPIIPIAFAATGVGATSFTANWKPETDADYYLLDVSLSSTFDTFVLENKNITAPTTSYLVTGLTPETTYYYRVRASIGDLPWGIAEWQNVNIQWQLITETYN
jgi:hypothetical protein